MSARPLVSYRSVPNLSSERSSTVSAPGEGGIILPVLGLGVGLVIMGFLLVF
ncbi:MAG: hypothetical protein ABJB33_06980 [Gemmatimonadota bacterium]